MLSFEEVVAVHFDKFYCVNEAALCASEGRLHRVLVARHGSAQRKLRRGRAAKWIRPWARAAGDEFDCAGTHHLASPRGWGSLTARLGFDLPITAWCRAYAAFMRRPAHQSRITMKNERISQPCSDMQDKGETIVITKPLILATSVMALVAISGSAYAGATISDKRYWPSEARLSSQTVVQRPQSAFGAAMAQFTETVGRRYSGGPKSAD
jgi:hypothetical protein